MALSKAAAVAHYTRLAEEAMALSAQELVAKEAGLRAAPVSENETSLGVRGAFAKTCTNRDGKAGLCVHCLRMGAEACQALCARSDGRRAVFGLHFVGK
jgi:hypothetical protein